MDHDIWEKELEILKQQREEDEEIKSFFKKITKIFKITKDE